MRRRMIRDYSGRFLVRIPVALHRTLAEQAATDRVSLNQYALYVFARGANLREFEQFLKSVKATRIQKLDTIIESERLAKTRRVRLRLMDLVIDELTLSKASGKLYLEGELSVEVEEHQELLGVEGKKVKMGSTYIAKITSKETKEEIRLKAVFLATYLGVRPISKEIGKNLAALRLSSYPGLVFRDFLEKMIDNFNLNVIIS